MRTSTKFVAGILLTVAGVAALASPVSAQVRRDAWIPVETNNVYWGLATGPVILQGPGLPSGGAYGYVGPAYGAVGQVPRAPVPAPTYDVTPRILDCVHVPFPQCSGAGN